MDELKLVAETDEDRHQAEWLPWLSLYLDNRLSAVSQPKLEGHLSECAACQEELVALRQTVQALQAIPALKIPRSFTISAAQARTLRPRPLYRAAQFAAAAAAAFLIISFGLDFGGFFADTAIAPVQAVVSQTEETTLVGTRPPAPTCPNNGLACAQSAALTPQAIATPEPVTPVATPLAVITKVSNFEGIRLVELALVGLTLAAGACAFALRPRAPNRLRS